MSESNIINRCKHRFFSCIGPKLIFCAFQRNNKNIKKDLAVSEAIGVILLVALGVLGFGIVASLIIPTVTFDEIPRVQVQAVYDSTDEELLLIHVGGDALYKKDIKINVDGVDKTSAFELDGASDWVEWKLGEKLILEIPILPNRVDLIYRKGGSETLISQITEIFEVT